MPKNVLGGKKHKRNKNINKNNTSKKIILANKYQIYAIVLKRLGGTRLEVECSDKKIRNAIIPGKFLKKIWMNPGDILLCNLDSISKINDNVCYIEHKYNEQHINELRKKKLINFDKDDNIQLDGCRFIEKKKIKSKENIDDIYNGIDEYINTLENNLEDNNDDVPMENIIYNNINKPIENIIYNKNDIIDQSIEIDLDLL